MSPFWLASTVFPRPTFSGKEKDAETGYHYFGARYYNSDLSIWLSVDPMADKYPSLSPYNYCAWNPLKSVDPDGADLTDFYDMSTGEHLKHVEDGNDEAIAINRAVFNSCEEDNASVSFEKNLGITLGSNSEFVALAGTLYAESTPGMSSYDEMAGIGSVIRNRAMAEKRTPFEIVSNAKSGIYGYKQRGKINSNLANKNKVNLAYKAAMVTLVCNHDYSNGAYFWQGRDFNEVGSPAYKEYYRKGFNFTDSGHDRYGMGSFVNPGSTPFKYESTAAAAGTIFMRLTDRWKRANGATRWNGR